MAVHFARSPRVLAALLVLGGLAAHAQQAPAPAQNLPPVTVTGKAADEPVEKSYRRMVRGMDLFERNRRELAPQASLRFKLLPRKRDTDLRNLELVVLGRSVEMPVDVAADHTFTLARNEKALAENAVVTPDRKALTMTWRAEVRTPGLPPNTRRLGDLRLECQVGMEAGLFSNSPSWITQIFSAPGNTPAYCDRADNQYLFFAERPLFGVTLVHGTRRENVPVHRLWGGALDDPRLQRGGLAYCDCEVLLDRTYYLPLADRSWPHDTLVLFDYMEERDAAVR
ncbi:MAG TPA: hypothetical protein VEA40_05135 [Ramlibacter sp.]|nr:hypothetical protein [Ramlibacter sp.]